MTFNNVHALWEDFWPTLGGLALFLFHAVSASHAVLSKRDVRAAIGWVGAIWLAPVVGPVLYLLFGINRISRRAAAKRGERVRQGRPSQHEHAHDVSNSSTWISPHLTPLAQLVSSITHQPLLGGGRVEPFFTGDDAYAAMLEAIESAEHTIALATYIFDMDDAGKRFATALIAATKRGVEVRVLIDDAGARYSYPRAHSVLRKASVPTAHFMPALSPFLVPYVNLRNHRKLLIVDGRRAFTGGMNIRQGHLQSAPAKHAVRDVHFAVEGPVVEHLQLVFAEDWLFAAREQLSGKLWFPASVAVGNTIARGIVDGPDDDFEALHWTLLGAIACAQRSIRIMTPYFLPDQSLTTALDVAAMRGVRVDIVVPEQVNIKPVQWAMWAHFEQIVDRGCHLWVTPGPFNHAKLCVVDDAWVLVGSANWDARSLRLNFEFCLECYDTTLARRLAKHIEQCRAVSRPIDLNTLEARSLPIRLRDGVFRLLAPYL